jgi:hypothetical protein
MRSLLVVGVLLLLPAAAHAAPPWSAPQTVSAPHLFVSSPFVGVAADGRALAMWGWRDGIGADARGGESKAVRPTGGGGFGPESRLLPTGRAGDPVLYGRSRAVLALQREAGSPRDPLSQLRIAFGSASGEFRASRLIASRARIVRPVLAGNARGDLALAWFEDRGTSNDTVYVSLRRVGGSFGPPMLLERGRIRNVTTAVGPRGEVLVAWDARGVIRTRWKSAGRRGFGARQTIASEDTFFADLHPAITANGRAYLAWSAQLITEGGDSGPAFFQVAVRPAGASRFRGAELLERRGTEHGQNTIDLAVGAGGGAVVAWSSFDGTRHHVRAAETDAAGRFTVRRELSAPADDAVLADVAADPQGGRIAVWSTLAVDTPEQVRAAFAPPGGAFGPPELVSPGREASDPRVAFDPAGRPTVVYANRPEGSAGVATRTVLEAATRAG